MELVQQHMFKVMSASSLEEPLHPWTRATFREAVYWNYIWWQRQLEQAPVWP